MAYFHQPCAHGQCQTTKARKYGTCRDPRCSLPCRAAHAAFWSPKLAERLQHYQNHGWLLYFGTLELRALVTPREYIAMRSKFQQLLRSYAAMRKCEVTFLGIGEIGASLMVHDHYAMAATATIEQPAIKSLWSAAVGALPETVYHRPMKSVVATARYLVKDKASHYPGGGAYVYLFARNTIRIRWGSKDFWTR